MTSVNTNAAALTALRTLQQTNSAMDATQNRISTGYKIGEAKDNAAYWSISTTLKSDNKSLATVKDALGLGAATVDVAYEGLNSAKDVLDEISAKLTSARQEGIDRGKLQQEITDLQNQLKSIAGGASFSGENWLSVNSTNASTYSANKEVVASFSRSASGSISIGTISVNISDVKLFDDNANADGLLDGKLALKDANGAALNFGGTAPSAPATTALTFGASIPGGVVVPASGPFITMDVPNYATLKGGDTFSFNINVDGSGNVPVVIRTADIKDNATLVSAFDAAIDAAIGNGKVNVSIDADGKLKLATASATSSSAISVGAASGIDTDGVVSSRAGLLSGTSAVNYGSAENAEVEMTGAPADQTYTAGDKVTFDLEYNGQVFKVEYEYDDADFATDGTVLQAEFLTAINTAIDSAKLSTNPATTLTANKVTAAIEGGKLVFKADEAGENKIAVSNLASYQAATPTVKDTTFDTTLFVGVDEATVKANQGTSAAASYAPGFVFDNTNVKPGDTITFNLNVNGEVHAVNVKTTGMTGDTSAPGKLADALKFKDLVQTAINATFTAPNRAKFDIVTTGGPPPSYAMTFETVSKGADKYIAFGNVTVADGDGVTSTLPGFNAAGATTPFNPGAPAGSARVSGTGTFSGPVTYSDTDSLSFTVAIGGTTTVAAQTLTINKALIDATLTAPGHVPGQIASDADFQSVLNAAITANGALNGKVSATVSSGTVTLAKTADAGVGTITVTNASATVGGNTMAVSDINLTSNAFTTLTTTQQKEAIEAYIRVVDSAAKSVTNAAAKLGSVAKRIDLQKEFAQTLMDTIDKGVGNLVDADMSEESTKLQALQVKQQLGVQALSIANQSAQQLLRLFQ